MRRILALSLSLVAGAGALGAQQPATAAQAADSSATAEDAALPPAASAEAVERAVNLRDATPWLNAPDAAPVDGPLAIPAGESHQGPIVVNGQLDVHGTVLGDAMTLAGDLIIHPGGRVDGRALAVAGTVRVAAEGGVVGEVLSVQGHAVSPVLPASAWERIRHSLVNVLTWLALVIVLGVGVLVFAAEQMDTVTKTLVQSVRRSFFAGLLGQMALIPALILLVIALAITVIGILLIPIVIVGYTVIAAGLLMLGLLAAALLIGSALGAGGSATDEEATRRRRALRALLLGIAVLFAPWILASLLTATPVAGGVVHTVALLVTWAAVTAGFGAVIRSRAGRRKLADRSVESLPAEDEISWQTPTPVGGVAAARRPTPAKSSRGRE